MAADNKVHDLHSWMSQVTDEMASEYGRIYANSSDDPGTAGDQGEENWAQLFRDWLPPTYQVATKGRLISPKGQLSPQMDVLVLKPTYPRKLMEKKIWLAHGVAASFECKNTLKSSHIDDAVARCEAVKSLFENDPRKGTPSRELRSPLVYGVLAHSHSWKSENSNPLDNIENALTKNRMKPSLPRFELDLICVADLAYWRRSWSTLSFDGNEKRQAFRRLFGDDPGPTTYMMQGALGSKGQAAHFRPIGGLIAGIVRELARDDASLRDIADYYRMCGLWGSGAGSGRVWPMGVYSDDVKEKILRPEFFSNGIPWNEWDVGGF